MKKSMSIHQVASLLCAGALTLCAAAQGFEHGAGGLLVGTGPAQVVEGENGTVTNAPVRRLLPLKQTDIAVEMIPGVVSADVRQLFYNDSPDYLEADYLFPLPADATISEMVIIINQERAVRSVVKERVEAQRTYEAAKEAGKRTALLNRNSGNLMNIRIANLAPGDSIEVHLVYFQPAAFDNGVYRLTVPTVVAKQYVPAEVWESAAGGDPVRMESIVQNASAPRLPPGVASDHHFSFSAVFSGIEVARITSPSHRIAVSRGEGRSESVITLADAISFPDRDVVVDITVKEPEGAAASFLTSEAAGTFYTVVSVVPAFDIPPAAKPERREIVFVVDTSGSMSGTPLAQAKQGIIRALGYLQSDDRFSIYEFNSEFRALVVDSAVNAAALASAQAAVAALVSQGGTEFLPVISHVLARSPLGGVRLIVFLTDGQSCQEDEVLRRIMADRTGSKIFPVSIGSAPNMALLGKMAEVGRGTVTSIRTEGDLADAIENLFAKIQKPVMTDIAVKLIDRHGTELEAEIYPSVFPDLFAGMPVKCAVLHRQLAGAALVLSGECRGETLVITAPLPERVAASHAAAQIFGQALISDLESRMLIAQDEGERTMLKDAIVQTALDFQLVCKYTSRVAVEELIERLPDNTLRYLPVPLHTPHGALESTATGDVAQMLAGALLLLAAAGLYAARIRPSRSLMSAEALAKEEAPNP